MTLQLGGGGAITGCTFLQEPDLIVSGLTVNGDLDAPKMIVASGTAAAPSYTFSGDTDNGLYYAGTNSIGLSTAGTNAILIDSSGRLLVATTVSMQTASTLQVSRLNGNGILTLGRDDASVSAGNGIGAIDFYGNVGGTYQQCSRILALAEGTHALGNKPTGLAFYTNSGSASATERMRIDSSGRLLVGTSSAIGHGVDNHDTITAVSTAGGGLLLGRNDITTVDGNNLGKIQFWGNDDNGTYQQCASIIAEADGTHATNDKPTRLMFSTTADGASSPTERLRINSIGRMTGHGVNINQVFALLYARIYNHGGCNINGPSADFTDFDSGLAAFTTVQRTVTSAPTNYSFIGDNHGNAFSFFVGCGGNGSFGTSNASNDANNYSSWVCIHNLFVAALNGLPTNATRTSLP